MKKEKELLKMGENGWVILSFVLPFFTAIAFSLFGWWALLWAGLPLLYLTIECWFKSEIIGKYLRGGKIDIVNTKGLSIWLYLLLVGIYCCLLKLVFKVIPDVVTNPRIDWGLTFAWILLGILGLVALGFVIFAIYSVIQWWINDNKEKAEELLGKNKVK